MICCSSKHAGEARAPRDDLTPTGAPKPAGDLQEPTILALPRGGVAVAAEVAAALDAPLDLILVRKVGVPFRPELAMGAVADGGGSIVVRAAVGLVAKSHGAGRTRTRLSSG